jgi:hypothetical protein
MAFSPFTLVARGTGSWDQDLAALIREIGLWAGLPPAGARVNARAKDRILYPACYACSPDPRQKRSAMSTQETYIPEKQ